MSDFQIIRYTPGHRSAVIALALDAWAPVFPHVRQEVPGFVYDAFYPAGWETRQAADVGALIDSGQGRVWLGLIDGALAGFVGIRLHPEDRMGEIEIIAVSPDFQRQGLGRALIGFAEDRIRDAGMDMVMVETVGDAGHAPARANYEAQGYQRWPVARYFKQL